jgi:hypothetical protein
LVELLVALVVLEFAAAVLLAAILTSFRLERRLNDGRRTDSQRRDAALSAMAADSCRLSVQPAVLELSFPATSSRGPLDVAVRCGR